MSIFHVECLHFKQTQITVEYGIFKGPVFKIDNGKIKWKKNRANLKDDNGVERKILKSSNPFTFSPWVEIDDVKYYPVVKLNPDGKRGSKLDSRWHSPPIYD